MKMIRNLFVVVGLVTLAFVNVACVVSGDMGLSTANGYHPIWGGSSTAQLPKFGCYDQYGNYAVRQQQVPYQVQQSQTFGKNEVVLINSSGELIEVLEGDVVRRTDIEPYGTLSLLCDVPFGGNVDVPIVVNIYKVDADKKVVLGQIFKTFHFYSGRRERLQWVISGPKTVPGGIYTGTVR